MNVCIIGPQGAWRLGSHPTGPALGLVGHAQQHAAAAALAAYSLDTSVVQRQRALCQADKALKDEVRQEARATSASAAALYGCQGERGTRWFHSLPISHLRVPREAEPVSLARPDFASTISRVATAHFSADAPTGLFRPGPVDAVAQLTLLAQLQRTLTQELRHAAEGPSGRKAKCAALDEARGYCSSLLQSAFAGGAVGDARENALEAYELMKQSRKALDDARQLLESASTLATVDVAANF
ncbi:hypothetical protein TSOC_007896, partial [Tetrabaena socialis]